MPQSDRLLYEALKARLWHVLDTELKDNRRATILQPLGCDYVKEGARQKKAVDSQLIAVKEAVDMAAGRTTGSSLTDV